MLWKCCTQYARRSGKLSSGHRTGKDQFSFQFPKKGIAKECANYYTIALIPHASKAMLKILHARIQRYVNWEISDVKARFSKGTGIRGQIANIHWIIEKAREFQKNYFCFTNYAKAFWLCGSHKTGKFLEMGVPDHFTCLLRDHMQVKKQQLQLDSQDSVVVMSQVGRKWWISRT